MTHQLTDDQLTVEEKLELIARCQSLVSERGHATGLYTWRLDLDIPSPSTTFFASIYYTLPDPLRAGSRNISMELRASRAGRVFLVSDMSRPDLALWGEGPYWPDGTSRGWPPEPGRYRAILDYLRATMVLDDLAGV